MSFNRKEDNRKNSPPAQHHRQSNGISSLEPPIRLLQDDNTISEDIDDADINQTIASSLVVVENNHSEEDVVAASINSSTNNSSREQRIQLKLDEMDNEEPYHDNTDTMNSMKSSTPSSVIVPDDIDDDGGGNGNNNNHNGNNPSDTIEEEDCHHNGKDNGASINPSDNNTAAVDASDVIDGENERKKLSTVKGGANSPDNKNALNNVHDDDDKGDVVTATGKKTSNRKHNNNRAARIMRQINNRVDERKEVNSSLEPQRNEDSRRRSLSDEMVEPTKEDFKRPTIWDPSDHNNSNGDGPLVGTTNGGANSSANNNDNQATRPGAHEARGRAFGNMPVWGRAAPQELSPQEEDTANDPEGNIMTTDDGPLINAFLVEQSSTRRNDSLVLATAEPLFWSKRKILVIVLIAIMMTAAVGTLIAIFVPRKSNAPALSVNMTTYTITIYIGLDEHPEETGWDFACGDTNIFDAPVGTYINETKRIMHTVTTDVADDEECVLTIIDSGTNGIANRLFGVYLSNTIAGGDKVVKKGFGNFTNMAQLRFVPDSLIAGTSLQPTIAPPSTVDTFPLTLVVHLDEYPEETSWSCVCDNETIARVGYGAYIFLNSAQINETVHVPKGSFCTYTLEDSIGDGLDLGDHFDDEGKYAVALYFGSDVTNDDMLLFGWEEFFFGGRTTSFLASDPSNSTPMVPFGVYVFVENISKENENSIKEKIHYKLSCSGGAYQLEGRLVTLKGQAIIIPVNDGDGCRVTLEDSTPGWTFLLCRTFIGGDLQHLEDNTPLGLLTSIRDREKPAEFLLPDAESHFPVSREVVDITILLQLDYDPHETGWSLVCNDNTIAKVTEGTYEMIYDVIFIRPRVRERFGLSLNTTCNFTINDSEGNGLEQDSAYEIYFGTDTNNKSNLLKYGGFEFNYSESVVFNVAPP